MNDPHNIKFDEKNLLSEIVDFQSFCDNAFYVYQYIFQFVFQQSFDLYVSKESFCKSKALQKLIFICLDGK